MAVSAPSGCGAAGSPGPGAARARAARARAYPRGVGSGSACGPPRSQALSATNSVLASTTSHGTSGGRGRPGFLSGRGLSAERMCQWAPVPDLEDETPGTQI